jgi:hypothetical protein
VGVPAHSCLDAPLKTRHGFAVCRADTLSEWQYVADHRGETVYDTGSGKPIVLSALGDYPPTTTLLLPMTPYDTWDGNQWVTDTTAQHAAEITNAETEKRRLQSAAAEIISPLNTAVKYEMATDDEKAKLARWEKYTVLLSRVNTSLAPDIEWPLLPA